MNLFAVLVRLRLSSRKITAPPIATAATDPNTATPKIMSPEAIEAIDTAAKWWTIATVVLTVLAAIAGFFAWWYASKSSDANAVALRLFQDSSRADIARANESAARLKEQAAKLENDTAQAKLELARVSERQKWRKATPKMLDVLKGNPPYKANILFFQESDECHTYAMGVWVWLKEAGWEVDLPKPGKASPHGFLTSNTGIAASGASVSLVTKDFGPIEPPPTNPLRILGDAFDADGVGAAWSALGKDSLLEVPPGIRIVIGPRF